MMQVRCQWCGWSYTLKSEAVEEAVAAAEATKATHHVENCPKCRRALKIQISEMKRRLPRKSGTAGAETSS
jgi:NAD-dependent SIR2 family protein deacetylase